MSRVSNTYYKGIIGSPDRICIRIPLPFGEGKIRRKAGDALYSFIKSSEISFTRGTDDTIFARQQFDDFSPAFSSLFSFFLFIYAQLWGKKISKNSQTEIFRNFYSIRPNVERYLTKQTNEQRFKANSFLLLLLHSFKFSKIPRCFLCFSMHVLS